MAVAAQKTETPPLDRLVSVLFGVGPKRTAQLSKLGIKTVGDLLLHRPRRYEDRKSFLPITELRLNEPVTTRGKIVTLGVNWFAKHTKSIFEIVLDDGTARLHCRWWNLPFMERYFALGDEVVVYGKPQALKPRAIDHPEHEVVEADEENSIHLHRITPIFPLTEGLPQRWLRGLMWRTLLQYEPHIVEPWPAELARDTWRSKKGEPLPGRIQAINQLHFPESTEAAEVARERLALDEFIELQRQILQRRKNFEAKSQALPCAGDNHLIKPFLARLGFKLTEAQTKVLRELRKDMGGPFPMRRLLQGDVGSGKTVVAGCCALMAIESGYHATLMAPTEILAEQHFRNFTNWFQPLGLRVELQTSSHKGNGDSRLSAKDQTSSAPGSSSGTAGVRHGFLFIGTHALLESSFSPENLGLVVIDEQHKFGVTQREALVRKGRYPHLLVMTATPIPRTLGLTLYGELDLSSIDSAPAGRGKITTFVRTADKLPKVYAFLREELARGRQAYVVYPRVEETGQPGLKAVTREFENLQSQLTPHRVGLVHGRLKSEEKEQVMAGFRAGSTQVLLATSLIEVGVDVPNATVMLIENAEQFGLAQLHQLRGRIGRGKHDSYCILVTDAKTKEARERLGVLEQTSDGFRIAEADLALRGPGELLGQQQSGLPPLRFASMTADFELLRQARQIAARLLGLEGVKDP